MTFLQSLFYYTFCTAYLALKQCDANVAADALLLVYIQVHHTTACIEKCQTKSSALFIHHSLRTCVPEKEIV